MKSLKEFNKLTSSDYLKATWYFETPLEKTILVILSLAGAWKILSLILSFII